MNGDLVGKTPMQMLDLVVAAAGQVAAAGEKSFGSCCGSW